MPTKYDVLAEVIEKAPCKPRDLDFSRPVYAHINSMIKSDWIKKTDKGLLLPVKNKDTYKIFKIISWTLKHNLNYNLFFSDNIEKVLKTLSKTSPILNPNELKGNIKNSKIIEFLEKNQFILLWKIKPKLGTLLNHPLFDLIIEKKVKENYLSFKEISEKVLSTPKKEVNPFDIKIFEFLAGSAQLEGSTVSIGETVDLVLKSIYPDKPAEDIQMVKNLNESMNYIINHLNEDLTLEHIKELNRLCLFSLHKGAGQFKKIQNRILGNPNFKTTPPELVVPELIKFCEEFNSIRNREECLKKLGFIHNQHQRIHGFIDGNSRTTRLLVNWFLMKYNLPMLILKVGSFEKYMSMTKLSDKRDDEELRNFILHVIYHEEILNK